MHDRPQVWVEESWKLQVYCSVYRLEARRFAETTEEQKREGERLLNGLLLMFESYVDHEVSEVLRDVCRHYDETFPYPNGRTDVPLHVVGEAVEEELRFHVQTGSLVLYEDNDRWWERLPPPEETAPPRRIPARVVPPREPPPPVEKTWFSAQFVDESGLWIDGLSVKMKAGGATNDLTTDKAGVVELRGQTEASAVVWVADIPQAEKILIDRMGRRDGAPAPTGRDVVDYAVEEPAKNVVLSAESPRTIVLGLERTWIDVRIVDDNDKPMAGKRARLHLADGVVIEKVLGDDGSIRADETITGACKLVLPVKDRTEWIDPDAPAPAEDPKELPEGHWIVRQNIEPPGPEVTELRTGESHKVVVGRKIAEQLEFDDALFRLMSAVLLPEAQNPGAAPTEPDGTRPTAMDLLAASLRYAELHPDRKVLITGHTDTSGGDEYNQDLSEFRAAAVYAVLANEGSSREDFGDLCHGPHLQGKEKKQQVLYDDRVQVLNWVAATFGWPCSTSGEYGDYLRAVKAFQSAYNTEGNEGHPVEQLAVDGDFGMASWRAVFDCYQVRLAEKLEITAQELRRLQQKVRGQFLSPPLVGCGENKPKEMAGVDNYRSQTNRRVEMLFFAPGHEPKTPCLRGECDPGACELYDRRWYRRKRLGTSALPQKPWMLLLVDMDGDLPWTPSDTLIVTDASRREVLRVLLAEGTVVDMRRRFVVPGHEAGKRYKAEVVCTHSSFVLFDQTRNTPCADDAML